MKLAIATTGRATHQPGWHSDSKGRRRDRQHTRCGVSMGPGWYVVDADEGPTCGRCRALAEHDRRAA